MVKGCNPKMEFRGRGIEFRRLKVSEILRTSANDSNVTQSTSRRHHIAGFKKKS